jgi:hypothetical protein
MRVHPSTKTNTKTRHKNGERGTACRLKICTLSSANSPHRRANSAKKTNCLSLSALCALVGLILWACLHQSQPSKRKQNISCRGSCSLSISVSPLKRECKKRDIYPKKKYFKYYNILPSHRGGEFESERAHRNNNLRETNDSLSPSIERKSRKVRSLKISERSLIILNPLSHRCLVSHTPVEPQKEPIVER